jgi:uncharacterized membrane protein
MYDRTEQHIVDGVLWLKLAVESVGALIIGVGVAVALYGLARVLLSRRGGGFTRVRLPLARYLALALEFQLAADILSTAVAPTWDQIGQLAAVAVIRTGLNYFLRREMAEEEAEMRGPGEGGGVGEPTARAT